MKLGESFYDLDYLGGFNFSPEIIKEINFQIRIDILENLYYEMRFSQSDIFGAISAVKSQYYYKQYRL
jgi:hypothetical protein